MFSIRRVKSDFEARLATPDGARCGKSEFTVYGNGERRFEARARFDSSVHSQEVAIIVNGHQIDEKLAENGVFRYDVKDRDGGVIPDIVAGDRIELTTGNIVIAQGEFEPD